MATVAQPISAPVKHNLEDHLWDYPLHMMGYASTLSSSGERDVVDQLRKVVEEITCKPAEATPKPRMGFF